MKCSRAKILLSSELDGELSPSEEIALTQHLAKCAGCVREKAELSSLRGTMSLWADGEPSEWLAQSFSYKLKDLVRDGRVACPEPARRKWRILGPAAAGVVTAMLLIMGIAHHLPEPLVGQVRVSPPTAARTQSNVARTNAHPVLTDLHAKNNLVAAVKPVRRVIYKRRHALSHTLLAAHPRIDNAHQSPYLSTTGTIAAPPKPAAEVTFIGGAKPTSEEALQANIGEAGLAMNQNVEKLRGKLQQAVDLLVSKPPMPAVTNSDSNGGK